MIKDMIDKQVLELKKLWANKRQLLFQLLNLAMIVFSALMIWKGLMFLTKVRKRHQLNAGMTGCWSCCLVTTRQHTELCRQPDHREF
mmetsp:Transcript_12352/g.29411  ORF Transcript_12352/g.29411 Transcript_12352/m.29411 type:complete len:87 (-) Transcript_12352:569-829(-)